VTDTPSTDARIASRTEAAARVWAKTRPSISPRSWSLKRRLSYAFAIAGVLFVAAGVALGFGLASMISAVNLQINRLDPAVRYSSYLNNALINEETGIRGYALTHQNSFLEPYQSGQRTEPGDVTTLRQLVAPYQKLRSDLRAVLDQTAGIPTMPCPRSAPSSKTRAWR
jgi:CHASE3 domain sensor protein